MPLIRITRIKKPNAYSKEEFSLTKKLLDALDVEYESDLTISKNCLPILCGDRELTFPEHYVYMDSIQKDKLIFRPLKNERHANIIIDMFEESSKIDFDRIEIREFLNDNDKKRYSGYAIKGSEKVKKSTVKSSPSIPILKCTIIAKLIFDKKQYLEFRDMLAMFLYTQKVS